MIVHICVVFVTLTYVVESALVVNVEDMRLSTRSFSLYSPNSRSLKNVLQLPSDVDLLKTNAIKTAQGVEKSRLKELYGGKRVTGAGVEACLDSFGNYVDGVVTGTLVLNINRDLPPESFCTITQYDALTIVLKTEGFAPDVPITELIITDTIFLDESSIAHRAYEVDLFVLDQERHPFYTIDRCSGIILDNFNKMIRFTVPPSVTDVPVTPADVTTLQVTALNPLVTDLNTAESVPYTTAASVQPDTLPATLVPVQSQTIVTTIAPVQPETVPVTVVQSETIATATAPVQPETIATTMVPIQPETIVTTIAPETVPTEIIPALTTTPILVTEPLTIPPDTTIPPVTTLAVTEPTVITTLPPTTLPPTTLPPTTLLTTLLPTTTEVIGVCPTPAVGIGGNTKTQQYNYGIPPRCLNPRVSGKLCFLENEFTKVVDLQGARYAFNPPVANFTCTEGYSDAVNGAFSPALDAYFFATISGRLLQEWYGHTQDMKPTVQVHYGKNVDNAFYNPNTNVLTFGDGNWLTYPLVSLDVVAHELAHGITTQHSNLRYKGESGGIDESFSDMAGEIAEAFFGTNDWLVGADLVKSEGSAFRYFADPSQDGNSINHFDLYKYNMDVHFSSGIFNHAFYRMVNIYNTDIRYAYEAFLKANLLYWKSTHGFVDAACGVVRGAYDTGIDVTNVAAAFLDVGITACSINTFIEKLDPAVMRTDLRVSDIVQPLFRLSVPTWNSGVKINAWSLDNQSVNIAVSYSISRNDPSLDTSIDSLTYTLPADSVRQMYIRLFTNSPSLTNSASLSIQFI